MYETNYSYIKCPYCGDKLSTQNRILEDGWIDGNWVNELNDEENDFFNCRECENFFYAELNIHKEYEYIIRKPTNEEITENNLIQNIDNIIEDVPGQTFMWDD